MAIGEKILLRLYMKWNVCMGSLILTESLDDIRKNVSKDIPFYDTDTLIASSELKAITLATPAETHYEIGMKILNLVKICM